MAGAPQRPPQAAQPASAGQQDRRRVQQQQAPAAAESPPAPDKGGRRNAMLPAVVIAAALLVAAFLLRGGDGGGDASVATSPTTVVAEAGDPAHVVALEPITLNLGDGSLAKVGIAIEIADPAVLAEIGEEAGNYGARALDALIEVFGEHTADELSASGGKTRAKEQLTERIREAYHDEVVAVYFTELAIP